MKNHKNRWILLCLLACFLGCGNGQVSLKGRITYADNGDPLEHGVVALVSSTIQARGMIRKDGRFTIGTYTEKDGLPPGEYSIFISDAVLSREHPKGGSPERIPLIDPKYSNPETSGLSLKVDSSTKNHEFQVERFHSK